MSKTDKEIMDEVLRRAEILDKKSRQRKKSVMALTLCVAVVFAVASAIPNLVVKDAPSPEASQTELSSSEQRPETENTEVSVNLFRETSKNPDYDSFEEDSTPTVELVIDGKFRYRQASFGEYSEYGLKTVLNESDFGEYIGSVAYLEDSKDRVRVRSNSTAPVGSSVYYYKNTNAVIVKNNEQCAVFIPI